MEKLTVRQKLIGYRKALGLTQEDMAQLLNMHRATYTKKEKRPDLFTMEEINIIQNYFAENIEDVPKIFF